MKTSKVLFISALVIYSFNSYGQKINSNWKSDLNTAVAAFKNCKGTIEKNINPCSKYIGESVNTVYQVNDFYSNDLKRYLTGTEIIKYLETSSQWTKVGFAFDQTNLSTSQDLANSKKAVIAVYMGEDNLGHVSIILPGELASSGSWGLKVPNSASFFMNSSQRSYSEKGLSYAFSRNMIKNVVIYRRNY